MSKTRIQNGDLLLFRPTGWLGKIVAWVTKSQYCHVAIVYDDDILEFREFVGHRQVSLLVAVAKWGDVPDVYRIIGYDPSTFHRVVNAFNAQSDVRYGWLHALKAGITRRLPNWLFRECEKHPPHCSEAVCRAFRLGAGIVLVPGKYDWRTTPGDLAKSIFVKKMER